MRIPLDYYRILGLPIQATAEQLKQSHRDRLLQVPRREYSELAINIRRQLIDAAYDVLGNPGRRAEYDQDFLASSHRTEPSAESASHEGDRTEASIPTVEIENHLLVGALLILLELGEYELVLRLGRPYLKRDVHSTEGLQLKEQPALPDIILTLAVACLELGREEWQQNHYEHAAESLETGRELLLKEDLFPVLRAEIQADLYKLRPYRCLELIARPLEQKRSRQEGINLLRGMLQDRSGIDGADDDLSGLGVDDFLRFVQQLRGYLTAAEQQEIFEAEAQRPSAVGTYLAVYALLARGFAQHQPALIRRAKQMLLRLSGRQDVHLEQAVCAVLLGQTEEASHALELSQEYDPLAFIREHSQGAPDLLPGLCLYAENWLQQEVFPFFRDLDQEPATLKDYFADGAVQTYLENLPLENERANRQSNWVNRSPQTQALSGQILANPAHENRLSSHSEGTSALIGSALVSGTAAAGTQPAGTAAAKALTAGTGHTTATVTGKSTLYSHRTTGVKPGSSDPVESGGSGSDSASSGSTDSGSAGSNSPSSNSPSSNRPGWKSRLSGPIGLAGGIGLANGTATHITEKVSRLSPPGQLRSGRGIGSATENNNASITRSRPERTSAVGRERRSGRRGNSPKWGRLALVILAGLGCLLTAGFLLNFIFSRLGGESANGPAVEGEPLALELNEPPIEVASSISATANIAADDASGIAAATINRWLEVKRAAYASGHDTSGLDTVLTGTALSDSQSDLQSAKANNWYIEYTHDGVEILAVEPTDATTADTLTVDAKVTESASVYEGEQRADEPSYTDDVVSITYQLVRQDGQWLIETAQPR